MKNSLKIALLTVMFLVSTFIMSAFIGVNPFIVAAVTVVLALAVPMKKGSLYVVNLNQVVVAELLQIFKNIKDDCFDGMKDESDKVNNDVIKFNDIGADPEVLIDNTIYPIDNSARTDDGIAVSLNKLETKNTKITAAEYHALPYDKNSSVMQGHIRALKEARVKLGLFSLAPLDNSNSKTPVLKTSGKATDAGRLRLTMQDLIDYKTLCDNNEDPETRRLVLCSDHINDLLSIDNVFRDRYYNIESGKLITRLLGFDVFENIRTPKFKADGTKKAFGAAGLSTDKSASVYFNTANAIKCIGSANMYYRDKSMDPENRMTVIGFDMYYMVNPVTSRGFGAIIDGDATT